MLIGLSKWGPATRGEKVTKCECNVVLTYPLPLDSGLLHHSLQPFPERKSGHT